MSISLHRTQRSSENGQPFDEAAAHLLAEVAELRRRLSAARHEIDVLKRKTSADSTHDNVLRADVFRREARSREAPNGCLARICIANLGHIVEQWGGEAADYVMNEVAQMLTGHIRSGDIVGRLGTGVFGVMLSHADLSGAQSKMSRLARRIEQLPVAWRGETLPIVIEEEVRRLTREGD